MLVLVLAIRVLEVVVVMLRRNLPYAPSAVIAYTVEVPGRGVAHVMLELREPVFDRVGLRIVRDGVLQGISRLLHQITDALTLVSTGVIDQEQVATQTVPVDDTPDEFYEPIGVHSASFVRLPAHTT